MKQIKKTSVIIFSLFTFIFSLGCTKSSLTSAQSPKAEYIDKYINVIDYSFSEIEDYFKLDSLKLANNGDKAIESFTVEISYDPKTKQPNDYLMIDLEQPIKANYVYLLQDPIDLTSAGLSLDLLYQAKVQVSDVSFLKEDAKSDETLYIEQSLKLTKPEMKITDEPFITNFKVKNKGNRQIKELYITLYIKEGNNYSHENVISLIPSDYILKPNKTLTISSDTMYSIKLPDGTTTVPEFDAKITKIKFND